jgi:hypothetical protein
MLPPPVEVMLPLSDIPSSAVREIAPATSTVELKIVEFEEVTERDVGAVVPPTAPLKVTSPVPAVTVRF